MKKLGFMLGLLKQAERMRVIKSSIMLLVLLFNTNFAFGDLKEQVQSGVDDYLANRFLNASFRFEDASGNEVSAGAKGIFDLTGKQLSAEQKMPVASGTKPFTAAAILKLQERKLLNVDDNLAKYFPKDLWGPNPQDNWGEKITLHHLLTHTSGIAEYVMKMRIDTTKAHKAVNKDILHFACTKPLEFEPGSEYRYTNTNYVILGLIIEQVSGRTLSQFFEEEFFKPLGMDNTHLATLQEAVTLQNAPEKTQYPVRYFLVPTGGKPEFVQAKADFVLVPFADGGIISNTRDMTKWYRLLSSEGVISKESYEIMTTKHYPMPDKFGRKNFTGYGIFVSELPAGDTMIYHPGSAIAIRSETGYILEKGLYFSILSNIMMHVPEEMKGKVDMDNSANQLDIVYFREAILKKLSERND